MKQIILGTLLAVLGTQATALSCMRPDPIETFQRLGQSDKAYIVLYGQLQFDEDAIKRAGDRGPAPAPVPGTFAGQGLTLTGFRDIADAQIEVAVSCAGPWCGSARSDIDAIYFVERTDDPLTVEADPCGGTIFEAPSSEVRAMLTSCMQGRTCQQLPFE